MHKRFRALVGLVVVDGRFKKRNRRFRNDIFLENDVAIHRCITLLSHLYCILHTLTDDVLILVSSCKMTNANVLL